MQIFKICFYWKQKKSLNYIQYVKKCFTHLTLNGILFPNFNEIERSCSENDPYTNMVYKYSKCCTLGSDDLLCWAKLKVIMKIIMFVWIAVVRRNVVLLNGYFLWCVLEILVPRYPHIIEFVQLIFVWIFLRVLELPGRGYQPWRSLKIHELRHMQIKKKK